MISYTTVIIPDHGQGDHDVHFDVHFSGPFLEVESDLASGTTNGNEKWCNAFRDLHDRDLAWRAPIDMLTDFLHTAPTELLRGYVLGILFIREIGPEGVRTMEWAARASSVEDAQMRGAVLGQAFMAAKASVSPQTPRASRRTTKTRTKRTRGSGRH